MSSPAGRKSTFAFQAEASLIANVPLRFEGYEEFAASLTEDQIIDYIMSEASNFQQDRLHDVSSHLLYTVLLLAA